MAINYNWKIDTKSLLSAWKNLDTRSGPIAMDIIKEIGCDFTNYLMFTSPVLTGRYRAGWSALMRECGRDAQLYAQNFQGRVPGTSSWEPETTVQQAIAQGASSSEVSFSADSIRLTNNVKYGPILEFGNSKVTQHVGHLDRTINDFMSQNDLWRKMNIELTDRASYFFKD